MTIAVTNFAQIDNFCLPYLSQLAIDIQNAAHGDEQQMITSAGKQWTFPEVAIVAVALSCMSSVLLPIPFLLVFPMSEVWLSLVEPDIFDWCGCIILLAFDDRKEGIALVTSK